MNIEVCPAPGDAAPSIPAQHIAGPKGPDSALVSGSPVSSGHIVSRRLWCNPQPFYHLHFPSSSPLSRPQDIQVILFWVTWALPCLEVSDAGRRQTKLAVSLRFFSCRQCRSSFPSSLPRRCCKRGSECCRPREASGLERSGLWPAAWMRRPRPRATFWAKYGREGRVDGDLGTTRCP